MVLFVTDVVVLNAGLGMIVLLGGLVGVHLKSKEVLKKLKSKQRSQFKWEVRFYKSCQVIKIKLGSNNFLDALTPLNCLDFSVSLTAQLLLVLDK